MSPRAFRDRLEVPPVVLIALFGMLAVASVNVSLVVRAAIDPPTNTSVGVVIGVTIAAGILLSFLPLLAEWALRSGWKSAPVIVTIVGVWTAPQILGYEDILGVVCGAAALAAVIAVWLPSARKYGVDLRALHQS